MILRGTLTTVITSDFEDLKAAWKLYGKDPLMGRFECEHVLTERQLGQLPRTLRKRLVLPDEEICGDEFEQWLEELYRLQDTR